MITIIEPFTAEIDGEEVFVFSPSQVPDELAEEWQARKLIQIEQKAKKESKL